MAVVEFRKVDVIFGADAATAAALEMLDSGADRDAILEATGAVLGVHDASALPRWDAAFKTRYVPFCADGF